MVDCILNRQIFTEYPLEILRELSSFVTHLPQNVSDVSLLSTVENMLGLVVRRCRNRWNFVSAQRRLFFCLGVNEPLKKTIFNIFFEAIQESDRQRHDEHNGTTGRRESES